jgi:hypothetical protein
MGTNCAALLAYLFLYLYKADFIKGFSRKAKNKDSPILNGLLTTKKNKYVVNKKFEHFHDISFLRIFW